MRWLKRKRRFRVVVQEHDGTCLEGTLLRVNRTGLVLTTASLVNGNRLVAMDGEVWVFKSDVAYLQFPSASWHEAGLAAA